MSRFERQKNFACSFQVVTCKIYYLYCLLLPPKKLFGILINSTGKQTALPFWNFVLLVVLEIRESTMCLASTSENMLSPSKKIIILLFCSSFKTVVHLGSVQGIPRGDVTVHNWQMKQMWWTLLTHQCFCMLLRSCKTFVCLTSTEGNKSNMEFDYLANLSNLWSNIY